MAKKKAKAKLMVAAERAGDQRGIAVAHPR